MHDTRGWSHQGIVVLKAISVLSLKQEEDAESFQLLCFTKGTSWARSEKSQPCSLGTALTSSTELKKAQ